MPVPQQGRASFRDGPVSISPGAGPANPNRTLMGVYPAGGTYEVVEIAGEVHLYRTPAPRTVDAAYAPVAAWQDANRRYWAARGA